MISATQNGPIALFARHATAGNLLLALMIVCGLFASTRINRQYFPDFGIDIVTVTVPWPGASAEDVDSNIVQALEPELRFLGGVKRVISSSFEGAASIVIEFEPGHEMQQALSEVESAVAQVITLPQDAEEPVIRRAIRYETISKVVISGPFPESALKAMAKSMRDELLRRGIDRVDLYGLRDEEIWVEVRPETLRRLDLKLDDIAQRIKDTSQDLPSGEIAGGERQIRSLGLLRRARDIKDIEIKSLPDGRKLYLHDIAKVSESFEAGSRTAFRNGLPAVELHVRRAINTDALEIAETVTDYLEEIRPTMPPSLKVELYDVRARFIRERIDLLINNGLGGLALVMLVLFLFLNARVAFWVAVGIPASLLATVAIMWVSGQTINMVSMFGMIMAIGIVVDDAIVVGEYAEARFQQGLSPIDAGILGARRMAAPVISATLTTVAAFMPLFLISGIIGQIIAAIPFVVVTVLLASLLECFFVLPGHLGHALRAAPKRDGALSRFRASFDARFDALRSGWFRRLVTRAVDYRYTTVAIAVTALLVAIGAVAGGRVGYQFFPSPEPDSIFANVEMISGTSRDATRLMVQEVEQALHRAAAKLEGPDNDLIEMSLGKLGAAVGGRGLEQTVASSDTIGGVVVELKTGDQRAVTAAQVMRTWREEIRQRPGLENLTIVAQQTGPPGRDIDIRLRGDSIDDLKACAREVTDLLKRYPGVSEVDDDLPTGKPEIILEVTQRGRAMGFTTAEVGRQVRNAVDGAVAKRFPRGDEEVWIRVQLDRSVVDSRMLNHLYLRSPKGAEVPLMEIVSVRRDTGYARIRREDGRREVAVTAEVDAVTATSADIIAGLLNDGLIDIAQRYGVSYEFSGRAEEQADTAADMRFGGMLGLTLIYIILAWVFSSYSRPIVVMVVIPLGFVGAVIGHMLWGFDLTILSIFAILGLAGIVINDSIVLVTTIDERRKHEDLEAAIVNGACERLRAVLLTSATTIGGLTPLLFERSLQAQFLIPMALTIVFGLAVTTFVVLLLVPALIGIQDDLHGFLSRRRQRAETARTAQ